MNDANSANAAFVEELTRFHSSRGTTLKIPKFNRSPLDLEKLWHAVRKNGGSSKVCEMKHWAQIGRIFGGTSADKNVSNNIKRAFTKWLLPYERAFFPEEAMSPTAEHTPSTTPRRKRQQLMQSSVEKKSRPTATTTTAYRKENPVVTSASCNKTNNNSNSDNSNTTATTNNNNNNRSERELRTTTMEMEGTPQPGVSVAMPAVQTSAASVETAPPSTQRPFVSIPHLTESKYYIILLPTTAAPQGIQENGGHGIRPGLTQLEHQHHHQDARTDGLVGIPSQVNGGLAGSVGENVVETAETVTQESSQLGDQLRVSFLVNQNQDSMPSEGQPLLPNIVVFKQDAHHHQSPPSLTGGSNEALGSRIANAADTASPGACDGQASVMATVSCSGLLCLFDGGIPQNAAPPAGMEER